MKKILSSKTYNISPIQRRSSTVFKEHPLCEHSDLLESICKESPDSKTPIPVEVREEVVTMLTLLYTDRSIRVKSKEPGEVVLKKGRTETRYEGINMLEVIDAGMYLLMKKMKQVLYQKVDIDDLIEKLEEEALEVEKKGPSCAKKTKKRKDREDNDNRRELIEFITGKVEETLKYYTDIKQIPLKYRPYIKTLLIEININGGSHTTIDLTEFTQLKKISVVTIGQAGLERFQKGCLKVNEEVSINLKIKESLVEARSVAGNKKNVLITRVKASLSKWNISKITVEVRQTRVSKSILKLIFGSTAKKIYLDGYLIELTEENITKSLDENKILKKLILNRIHLEGRVLDVIGKSSVRQLILCSNTFQELVIPETLKGLDSFSVYDSFKREGMIGVDTTVRELITCALRDGVQSISMIPPKGATRRLEEVRPLIQRLQIGELRERETLELSGIEVGLRPEDIEAILEGEIQNIGLEEYNFSGVKEELAVSNKLRTLKLINIKELASGLISKLFKLGKCEDIVLEGLDLKGVEEFKRPNKALKRIEIKNCIGISEALVQFLLSLPLEMLSISGVQWSKIQEINHPIQVRSLKILMKYFHFERGAVIEKMPQNMFVQMTKGSVRKIEVQNINFEGQCIPESLGGLKEINLSQVRNIPKKLNQMCLESDLKTVYIQTVK